MKKEELFQFINNMTPAQQKEILLKYLDNCSDEQREFLENIIFEVCEENLEKKKAKKLLKLPKEVVEEKMQQINEWMRQIEEGELYLEADGYEDYSNGYWASDWVWEYYDEMDIKSKLMIMIDFSNDCVNHGNYTQALEILNYLLELEIEVQNPWDNFGADLETLVDNKIISVDLQKIALQTLYVAYQLQKPNDRAEDLYLYFSSYYIFKNIHIEDMLTIGREELQGLNEFWENWIYLLEGKEGDLESRLLREAIFYYKGMDGIEEVAARNYNSHPSLSVMVLREYAKCHDYKAMEKFGIQTLKNMDISLKIRSEIALMTAFAAECLQHTEKEYRCYFEAFRSHSSIKNLFRLHVNEQLFMKYKDSVKKIILNIPRQQNLNTFNEELAKNIVHTFVYNELCFYIGRFGYVRQNIQNPENSLGWSGTFIRTGLSLFLVYLYDKEIPTKSMNFLMERIDFREVEDGEFLPELERKMLSQSSEGNPFWYYFQCWKKYYVLEQTRKEKYYLWAKNIIHARADAIVGGKFRNHYREVAVLLAALGDIKESWGDVGEKEKIRLTYKNKFPRHNAFQREMKEYF